MKYYLLQSEDIRRVLQNDNILILGKKTDIEIKLLIQNNAVN
jgi:predicted transcriptional regulator